MINRSIISPDSGEDYSFVNTSYNLASSIQDLGEQNSLRSIRNITFVPRAGTHNNFKSKEEIFIYVINGEMSYCDSIGNKYLLKKGHMLYINSSDGMTYDIFNGGPDYLDLIIIESYLCQSDLKLCSSPKIELNTENSILYNSWNYRVSSRNGLAPIKCFNDINIYTLDLDENETIDFNIRKDRTGYLLQCFGSSQFLSETTDSEFELNGSDGLKICHESFDIISNIHSSFILVEAPLQ